MRRGILQDKHSIGWRKIIFADLICLVIVVTLSFGLCYAYFSDRADMEGSSTMGVLKVMYCKNSTDTIGSASVFGSIGGDTAQELSSIAYVAPGSTLAIKGYAVNSSNFDIFVLGRLEIVITTPSEQTETEVVWYNIQNGQELYVERGRFQVGASVLYAHGVSGDKQEINAVYTFDGDKYINGYSIQSVTFEVLGHQAEHLDFANDMDLDASYNSYTTQSGGKNEYNDTSKKLACHYITKRKLDVWKASDANANGVLSDLYTDSSGAYLINSCADWMIFRKLTQTQSNTQGKTFKLNCYLDFSDTTTAINLSNFYGNFDGQGYTLSNIFVSATESWGLFASTQSGSIKNLGIDGLRANCTYTSTGTLALGGLVAFQYQGNITNCFVIGASVYDSSIDYDIVATTSSTTDVRVGGIIGNMRGDNTSSTATATMLNCYAILNIQASAGSTGGIVGQMYPTCCKVEQSYFSGKISSGNYGGAIVGNASSCGKVENCFADIKSLTRTTSSSSAMCGTGDTGVVNCAYLKDSVISKEGQNQTSQSITEGTFKSIGKLRDTLGWDTTVWADDIYHSAKGLPMLRAFYNF